MVFDERGTPALIRFPRLQPTELATLFVQTPVARRDLGVVLSTVLGNSMQKLGNNIVKSGNYIRRPRNSDLRPHKSNVVLLGYLAHKKTHLPLGLPQDPRHRPTVGNSRLLRFLMSEVPL